jgi:YfiH family protein
VLELPDPDAERPEADGIATPLQDVAAVVVTADCLPVALVAQEAVAMIHAGWRGLAADVLAEGVKAMREVGAEGEIHAAIGPSIGVCCYEVNTWVHRAFMKYPRGVARLSNHAHLKNVARLQLQHVGVPLDHVHDVDICTMCAPRSLFHSHRRDYGDDVENTGRQASAVWRVGEPGGDWPS